MKEANCNHEENIAKPKRPCIRRQDSVTMMVEKYKIAKHVLGTGGFSKVFLASLKTDPSHKVAIKVITKHKICSDLQEIFDEIKYLKDLDHPNIVKYKETYQDTQFLYIVMELCEGGELFYMIRHRMAKEGTFHESEAAEIMKSCLKAIAHCHSYQIAHRDIKPENIMISSEGVVKLIDFGLSKQAKSQAMRSFVGSPYYVAPEIINEQYGIECDIWSLGVILYFMLSGYLPFDGTNILDIFAKIKEGVYDFRQKEWEKVSGEAKDLIRNMIEPNKELRFTAQECLNHEWFMVAEDLKDDEEKDALDTDLLTHLKEYKSTSVLKKAALNVFVKMLSAQDVKNLERSFERIDIGRTGYIDSYELSEAMKRCALDVPAQEIEKIIHEIDYKGNKQINYSEFLAATIQAKKILNEGNLKILFNEFDIDNSGYITKENLEEVFERFDKKLTQQEIDNIIDQHDKEKDGQISYIEFKAMMLDEEDLVDKILEGNL